MPYLATTRHFWQPCVRMPRDGRRLDRIEKSIIFNFLKFILKTSPRSSDTCTYSININLCSCAAISWTNEVNWYRREMSLIIPHSAAETNNLMQRRLVRNQKKFDYSVTRRDRFVYVWCWLGTMYWNDKQQTEKIE